MSKVSGVKSGRGGAGILPRMIRFRDAPAYLGMDRNRFNAEVRPHLVEIPIGTQGIAFDRLALDAWVDDYIRRNGRPYGENVWDVAKQPVCIAEEKSGISTGKSEVSEFEKALDHANSRKRKRT